MELISAIHPKTIPISRKDYELVSDVSYLWKIDGAVFKLIIPKGFVCDGASIPWFLWSVLKLHPDGLMRSASWLHDYVYRYGGFVPKTQFFVAVNGEWKESKRHISKTESDGLFRMIMEYHGISKFKAGIAWMGVVSFGWITWNKNKKEYQR